MHQLPLYVAAFLGAVAVVPQSAPSKGDEFAAQRELARQRYQRVEAELARADVSGLSDAQHRARAEVLAALDAYVVRADFGVQGEDPLAGIPLFVDGDGRRCAMAELLHATGRIDLVSTVQQANNDAWIVDLSEHQVFLEWLDEHGLSLFEAARIQGPPMPRPPPPEYDGPGDTLPASPGGATATPGTGGPSGPTRPSTPGASSPGPGTPGPNGPTTPPPGAAALTENDLGWSTWWEFNKIEFLRPNRLALDRARDDGDADRTFASQVGFLRRAMLPSLLRALDHPDARVRAAAARAVGRVGGPQALEPLLAKLDDPSLDVRDMVVLGLGATGAREVQRALVQIAREGRLEGGKDLGRRARALAIVALGLGRRTGFDASADKEVIALVRSRAPADKEALGVAAMTYALMSPSEALTAVALELAGDKSESMPVRCRAIEALRGRDDTSTLSALQDLASGSRIELRRSAALALGEFGHPLAAAGLMTAHDLEKEPLAKAFLLVSLGRQGGEKARDYLIDALKNGPGFERPWAALALGLVARDTGDEVAAAALREGVAREKHAEDRGAYWLALGIARDAEALEILRTALSQASDSRSRMYAAQALAMLRGDEAHHALAQRIEIERSTLTRSQIALALGVLGERGDVDPISKMLASASDPVLQGQVAAAMAFHGSSEALHRLGQLITNERIDDGTRAASVDALGMILSSGTALSLGEASRSSNFTLFGDWLTAAVATTL